MSYILDALGRPPEQRGSTGLRAVPTHAGADRRLAHVARALGRGWRPADRQRARCWPGSSARWAGAGPAATDARANPAPRPASHWLSRARRPALRRRRRPSRVPRPPCRPLWSPHRMRPAIRPAPKTAPPPGHRVTASRAMPTEPRVLVPERPNAQPAVEPTAAPSSRSRAGVIEPLPPSTAPRPAGGQRRAGRSRQAQARSGLFLRHARAAAGVHQRPQSTSRATRPMEASGWSRSRKTAWS